MPQDPEGFRLSALYNLAAPLYVQDAATHRTQSLCLALDMVSASELVQRVAIWRDYFQLGELAKLAASLGYRGNGVFWKL